MLRYFFSLLLVSGILSADPAAVCVSHDTIPKFGHNGNTLQALSSKTLGANQYEVWRSSIAVGSRTPRHVHETEEVFIILQGKILAVVGDEEILCEAPSTLICPANVSHQLFNVGDERTDHFLVIGIDSAINDDDGNEMHLPWR